MQQEDIRYVPIWSGWVRLTHWLMALGVLFQLVSAWAIQLGSSDYEFWRDWHVISGQLLLVAVVGRVILMFILPGTGSWRAFLPDRVQGKGAMEMLRFYFSFARFPLPNWFAHNPFWRQLYPLILLVLIGCGISGLVYNAPYTFAGVVMHQWHSVLADVIVFFSVAHVLAAFLHDLKGKGAAISGMISGFRYFHVPAAASKPEQASPFKGSTPPVYVSVDSIKIKRREP
jgi:Ni/Fe-hydrogenase 1 B-type cytochrome subunit